MSKQSYTDGTEPVRTPSPCESCPVNIKCKTKCFTWQNWFVERWKATRKMFGVESNSTIPKSAGPFGDRLLKVRQKAGLSQKELAERVGLTENMIHRYETEEHRPPPKTLQRFADALGVTVGELTGLEEGEPR